MTDLVVLHVLEAIETGCARHVVDVVRHTKGVRHHVAAPLERVGGVTDRAAAESIVAAGGEMHRIEMRRSLVSSRNPAALVQLHRLVKELAPDIVHGHSSIGGALGRLASLRSGAQRVYTPNALAVGRAVTFAERQLARITDAVVAVSPSEADDMVHRGIAPAARITIIPNGIDLDPPEPRDLRGLLGIGPAAPLIATMGRIGWQKASDQFVLAAAELADSHPEAEFLLIGDGPDRASVLALAEDLLGARFHWLRELPGAAAYLHDVTVFALPSRFEGGPYAPLEAIRSGVPVVLSDAAGNRDVIENQRSGLLVRAEDPSALARAMQELLDDPQRREELAAEARHRLRSQFDVRQMGVLLRSLYQQVRRPKSQESDGGLTN